VPRHLYGRWDQAQRQIMMNYTELASTPPIILGRSLISCGWQCLPT